MDSPLILLALALPLVAYVCWRLGFRAGRKEGRLEARDMVANYNYYLRSPTVRMLTRALYDFCEGKELDSKRKEADAQQIVADKLERRAAEKAGES
jgi:hypothetical protein